ncbi:MAG: hypothetical protein ABI377_12695 [Devosia sp.]
MLNVARQQRLADLRERIATIEKRPLLADGAALLSEGEDRRSDWQALLKAPAGLLQEIYADEERNSTAAFGFALGLARQLITPARPAILFLQLTHEAQETGLPYGPGLKHFGFDPERLIIGRMATPAELLWAVEEAIACRAVAAVVAEVLGAPKVFDFTASRRLSLRAASGGASVFMLRYGVEREATAARLRWRIAPAVSRPPPFDDQAPGNPRWQVTIEKGRVRQGLVGMGLELLVDWTRDGFVPAVGGERESAGGVRAYPAPYGAPSEAVGDRLSQAG